MTERSIAEEIVNARKRVAGFVEDLRRQGIHVGFGSSPHCVVDGEAWPCSTARVNRDRPGGTE